MAELYRRFESSEWTVTSGSVTFNADGSVRLLNDGSNAIIYYTDWRNSNGGLSLPSGSNNFVVVLHGQVVTAGRSRVWIRNIGNSAYALLEYPGTVDSYAQQTIETVVQAAGGISEFRFQTDQASSDITIDRWSFFGDGELDGLSSGGGNIIVIED